MFEDFSLNNFLSDVNEGLTSAGLGGTKGLIEQIGSGTKSSNKNTSNAQAIKYQNIQQKTSAPTSATIPLDTKTLMFGGAILVGIVLLAKG